MHFGVRGQVAGEAYAQRGPPQGLAELGDDLRGYLAEAVPTDDVDEYFAAPLPLGQRRRLRLGHVS